MFSIMKSAVIAITVITFISVALGRPTEDERIRAWKKVNKWPPVWQAETEGISSSCLIVAVVQEVYVQ